jgi:hypothetical protein
VVMRATTATAIRIIRSPPTSHELPRMPCHSWKRKNLANPARRGKDTGKKKRPRRHSPGHA